jgi:hypothetical protein
MESEKEGLTGKTSQRKSWLARLFARVFYPNGPQEAAWTLTHAHFVQMGGIVFKAQGGQAGFKNPKVWDDEEIKSFFALRVPEEAISDKSKGSVLAKTLVVMQVLWFVIQTVARAVEGLPITHLEVVCLAFTAFNIGMYICWWDKPLDVEYPLEAAGTPIDDLGGHLKAESKLRWAAIMVGNLDALTVGEWIYSPKRRLYSSLYCYTDDSEGNSFLNSYFDSNKGELGSTFAMAVSFTSASFGALHCLGWSLPSPSPAEYMLWRISSLILLSYPLVPLLLTPFTQWLVNRDPDGVAFTAIAVSSIFLFAITFLSGVAYTAARCTLLVLPFLELRELPPLAHQTVAWSNFLPHV